MERQDRGTKKILKVLIAIGVILILALIAALVYFSSLKIELKMKRI